MTAAITTSITASITTTWARLRTRYAALAPRERLLLPAALGIAILVLGQMLLIEPARRAHRLLQQQHTQDSRELLVAQTQLDVLRQKVQHPDAELRAQLEALRTQARGADERFRLLQSALVPAQDMSAWLSGLMQAQRGLQLVGLRSLPVTSLTALSNTASTSPIPGTASAASAPDATPDAWLYRHGVEVSVRGSYAELVAYLHALERMPRRVYWGELRLDARDSPAVVMTLTVYTLSVDKTWWLI